MTPARPFTMLHPLLFRYSALAFILFVLSSLLSGCNNDILSHTDFESSTQSETSAPTQSAPSRANTTDTGVAGRVVKGIISNAQISAYPIVEKGGVYVIDKNQPVQTAKTNSRGYYELKVGKGRSSQYFYLEMSTDLSTRMICDYHEGCYSEQTNTLAAFGELTTLPTGFSLSNVVQSKAGKISNIPITPLTHLVVQAAQQDKNGFSPASIDAATSRITTAFNLDASDLSLQPSDLTSLEELKRLDALQLKLGVLSAAFMPWINLTGWDDPNRIPVDSILEKSVALSAFLKSQVQSSQHFKVIVAVEDEIASSLSSSELNLGLTILKQPESLVLREGESATLSVQAQGSGTLLYQWQKGGTVLVGETAATLQFNPVTLSDAGTYGVVISDDNGSIRSAFVDVTVNEAIAQIEIQKHPISLTRVEGTSASFYVEASAGGYISYQWRKDQQPIPDAYSSSYTITTTNLDDSASYDVVISNSTGSITSNAATLNVVPDIAAVSISQQPVSQSINEGESTILSIQASGGGTIRYQWFKDRLAIAGANSAQLQIASAQYHDQGEYVVAVSNEVNSVTSNPANVTVAVSERLLSLSWSIPSQREDGSLLTIEDIYGYAIAYQYQDGSLVDYIVEGARNTHSQVALLPGRYAFRIATIDSNSELGTYSSPIQVSID